MKKHYTNIPKLRITTRRTAVEIIGEPFPYFHPRYGYSLAVLVKAGKARKTYIMFLTAKSIARQLEPLKKANRNKFRGLKFTIRKETKAPASKYIVEPIS